MSCGEWALTLAAVIVVFVLTAMFVLASVGIAPVIDANGLSWDATGYVTHEANRTARYVVQQQEQTERNRQDDETLRTFAVVGALASVLVVAIVQHNRTKRKQAETTLKLQMYLAYLGASGHIGKLNGQLGVFDHDRHEFVPAHVALLELKGNGY